MRMSAAEADKDKRISELEAMVQELADDLETSLALLYGGNLNSNYRARRGVVWRARALLGEPRQ